MIGRRILQQRPWNSAQRWWLCSCTSFTPPSALALSELEKHPLRRFYSQLTPSLWATPSLDFGSSYSGWNTAYNVRRCWFSSNAVADTAVEGIVDVPLAQTGEGIAECELLRWYVQEGDQIEEFQPICEVQSDKATIEITSRYKGKVAQIHYAPGEIVKVGETLLKMLVEEVHLQPPITDGLENRDSPISEVLKSTSCGVLSTPTVRGLAKEYRIDITDIHGTGKDGRVLKEDVLRYAVAKGIIEESTASKNTFEKDPFVEEAKSHPYAASNFGIQPKDETITLRGFQRAMVKSMSMAAKVPHFYYLEDINCDALVELKTSFQENNTDPSIKHTFLPLLIKSLSMALSKFPLMNSCFKEESLEVTFKGSHNIGIAMATPNGLVVPNIKNVQSLSILEVSSSGCLVCRNPLVNVDYLHILAFVKAKRGNVEGNLGPNRFPGFSGSRKITPTGNLDSHPKQWVSRITKELSRLQKMAVENKLNPEDISDGTITLSNIGAIGGKCGSPLLNLPEVSIIAIGRIYKAPVFAEGGTVCPVSMMTVNVGADHRVLDGATVARFCNEWKRYIEKPEFLMLQLR